MGRRRNRVYPDKLKDRTTCPPTVRLRDLLRLGNNPTLFRNLKRQLQSIAEKHLAPEFIIREQAEEWVAIESELISTLPDIFGGESSQDLVQLAFQMIRRYHYRRRFLSKHNQIQSAALPPRKHSFVMSVTVPTRAALEKEREEAKNQKETKNLKEREETKNQEEREEAKNQKEIEIIDITLDDDGEYDEKPKTKVEFVEPKLPLTMDISNRLPGPATIKRASRSTSPLKLNSSHIARPSTLWSPAARVISQNIPLHAESSSQARSSSNNTSLMQGSNEDAFKLTGVTRVARFLNACSPPMAHFLQPFINFGCTSEEYLVAVSTWPTDKISHFLKQVVGCGNDKRQFSQMDLIILQNHFISYFNNVQT